MPIKTLPKKPKSTAPIGGMRWFSACRAVATATLITSCALAGIGGAPEWTFAAGVAGLRGSHHGAQTRVEYHFGHSILSQADLRFYLAGGVASGEAYHVGGGLAYSHVWGSRFRLLAGSGPALYHRMHGFNLGDSLEFFSFLELDRSLGSGQWLGLRIAHVSNASLGTSNPGREMVGIAYTRSLGRGQKDRNSDAE